MNETQETIARALEISLKFTDAETTWLRSDPNGNVYMNERLLNTMESVIRIFNARNLASLVNDSGVKTGWALIHPKEMQL